MLPRYDVKCNAGEDDYSIDLDGINDGGGVGGGVMVL
jgi:hypothetical protein